MFKNKLKEAMDELNLKQSQVVGLTGCSKAAVSQYLSGKNEPSQQKKRVIAEALGLDPDYFEQDAPAPVIVKGDEIRQLSVKDVAVLMHKHVNTIRAGLQQGVFPWGYAVHTSEHRWSYFINAERFAEIEGVKL